MDPKMERKEFYIFGRGISFSISPTIHSTGFTHYNLPYTYSIRESNRIDEVSHLISSPSFGGASVTMPHKLDADKFCDAQSETAQLIGAINTLIPVQTESGRIIRGDNTDWTGLYTLITEYMESAQSEVLNVGLVIGAGGASRAALYALYKAGVREIYLFNRTLSTAEKVRDDFAGLFRIQVVVGSLDELPKSPEVVIGTVPAETTTEKMFGGLFSGKGLCIEMSYKPRETPLLKVAKGQEWKTVTGVEVLLAQGYDQFRLWTGLEPPKREMREAVVAREGSSSGRL